MKYSFIEYLFVYLRCDVINIVVVVLKAATSFAGIDYNERKNEEGKSCLLYTSYSISNDSITLPLKSQFKDGESFYCTELHEMGHSTGVKMCIRDRYLCSF